MSKLTLLRTSKLFQLTSLSVALTLVGCGGGGRDTVDSIAPRPDIGVVPDTSANTGDNSEQILKNADIFISLDKDEINTGTDKTTATILVTDENGGILSGVPVDISIENAAKYGLSLSKSSNQTTDSDGKVAVDIVQSSANANINAQINHQTQLKVIVSNSKKKKIAEQSASIIVTGTQIENVSASTGVLGNDDNFSIEGMLVDGSGEAIKNATVILYNNDKEIDTRKTDGQGNFVFDTNSSLLTKMKDSYLFSMEVQGSQGVSQRISNIIEIPSTSSVNIAFPKIPDILVTARRRVVVNVPNAKNGDMVKISTTKGKIYKGTYEQVGFDGSLSQQFTVNNRQVAFYIRSEAVGPATITAQYNENSQKTSINFISTTPDKIDLQVNKAVLGTAESTPVAVRVYDKDDNPIKNAVVSFSVIRDASGGQLDKGLVYTDADGVATSNYTAGNNATSADGVIIEAKVQSVRLPNGQEKAVNPIMKTIPLTVQTSSSYVGFALSDKISSSSDNIYYMKQGSIFVTNNVGQPAANQQVTLSLIPDEYYTGTHRIITKTVKVAAANGSNNSGGDGSNTDATQNTAATEKQVQVWAKCSQGHPSEDKNRNGFLDPNEDANNNNKLDPINVATILKNIGDSNTDASQEANTKQVKKVTFTTDNTGKVDFVIRYPKNYAQWFTATITVNTRVDGSESQSSRYITFPVLVDDVDLEQGIFPNHVSPFGSDYGNSRCIALEKAE